MTTTLQDPIGVFGDTLEEQFRRHTDHLAGLVLSSQRPDLGGYDDDVLTARIASARQAVADTAHALRRMADGSYGTCERCSGAIPRERLEILPQARFCVPCQKAATG